MIITISGAPGSGKSTIGKMLAKKLGWPRYYIGNLRREIAKDKGLTLAEYNKLGETDPATDLKFDAYQKKLGQIQDNFIIEGRTSWFFIPHSIKLYLDVQEKEGADRVFKELRKKNLRNEDIDLKSMADVLASHRRRKKSDIKRYKKYYNIDVFDEKNYDYVLDTTNFNINQVLNKIYIYLQKHIKTS